MFLEALMCWLAVGLLIIILGVLYEMSIFLDNVDPEDKILKKLLGNKFYNFLNKIL